jgi:hypothetical protein
MQHDPSGTQCLLAAVDKAACGWVVDQSEPGAVPLALRLSAYPRRVATDEWAALNIAQSNPTGKGARRRCGAPEAGRCDARRTG